MDHLTWCMGAKHGVMLVPPSENLSRAYLMKAQDALEARESVRSHDWKVSTGYYAIYFALYAVMMRVGIRSEIHTCSIEVMRQVLSRYFEPERSSWWNRHKRRGLRHSIIPHR